MITLFFEKLADENRGRVSLIHVFPGIIITPGYKNSQNPTWWKIAYVFISPLLRMMSTSKEDFGTRAVYLALPEFPPKPADGKAVTEGSTPQVAVGSNSIRGSGAYMIDNNGDSCPEKEVYKKLRQQGMTETVYQHTLSVFARAQGKYS